MTTYNARFYEGRYIIGQIAAKMSKTGIAGYIVSFPIPEVIMGINAFMLGAQSVNPDFKLKIVWVNSWFDPGKEGDAAKALFDQGADIITQHTDSPAPLQIAEERGLHGFGQSHGHDHVRAEGPATPRSIDNWGPYYIERAKAVLDGTWKSQASWDGLDGQACVVDGALHQHARRRGGGGQGHRGEDQVRRVPSLHRADLQAGRHARRSGRQERSTTARCSA